MKCLKINMKRGILFIGLISIVLTNCATSMSKTAYRDYWTGIDYYALMKKLPEKDRWDTCFEITEVEKETEINKIYLECIDRELQGMPDTISSSEDRKFETKLYSCTWSRFLVKHRYKFIDKSPEYSHLCKATGMIIRHLK
jgi:hypothetical protein